MALKDAGNKAQFKCTFINPNANDLSVVLGKIFGKEIARRNRQKSFELRKNKVEFATLS